MDNGHDCDGAWQHGDEDIIDANQIKESQFDANRKNTVQQ